MSRNLLDLDVDQLFETHKIEEIIEIEKLLDAEIERKRVELRSMVGDRYKDVLAASDAIKNMKAISQQIVDNIQIVSDVCEDLISQVDDKALSVTLQQEKQKDEKRELIIQVRLALFINEQIWTALDKDDNLTAAQFYLLAQHIHTGLNLSKKEYLNKLPLLRQIKTNLVTLRDQIFHRIKCKLESLDITAGETSSNLNALLLLKNQSTNDLLNIFIEHRKSTLNKVMNTPHASVRMQISAMVTCLVTTIQLLHDCFMCYADSRKGLIWQQLQTIVSESSPPTLSKIDLPVTPLISYLPDIVQQFRPKYKSEIEETVKNVKLEEWLSNTKTITRQGLESSLKLITTVKGLHIIREEALKLELPSEWAKICLESNLPQDFNVWYYFFQDLMTQRGRELISKKVLEIVSGLQSDLKVVLGGDLGPEMDLRWYTWAEDENDISKVENNHTGLSMKTFGYSPNIVTLCENLDSKFFDLLKDVSQYLYGKEYSEDVIILSQMKEKKKFVDREHLENHLRIESRQHSASLPLFLKEYLQVDSTVSKVLLCARFLQAVTVLCPHFNKCCTFNSATDEWTEICANFNKTAVEFWEIWVQKCVQETDKMALKLFKEVGVCSMISLFLRWDNIEIQEQTESQTFKSHIKVPLKASLLLHSLLNKLNADLSHILPHTLPKPVHLLFLHRNISALLQHYSSLASQSLNQNQSLQFLFDVKFLSTLCIPREHSDLVGLAQEICDKLRAKIDPFDLDVFYDHLQGNVKRAVLQSQAILGCLMPSSAQLANLGVVGGGREQEASVMALSAVAVPSFCGFAHVQKAAAKVAADVDKVSSPRPSKTTPKKSPDPTAALRSSAAALFGGLTTDWFS